MMLFVVIIGQEKEKEKREKRKEKDYSHSRRKKKKSNEFSIKDLNTRKPIFFFKKLYKLIMNRKANGKG